MIELDWQVIKETFAIKTVSKAEFTETYKQKGIGRVQKGQKLLDIIHKR